MSQKIRLPTEIPIEEYPPPQVFIEEALDCVKAAANEGIILRIMGGMAIYLHSKEYEELWRKLGRLGERVFTDIDFMSYSRFSGKIVKFFTQRGYFYDRNLMLQFGHARHIYFGGKVPMIDVFLDKLDMCHVIDFRQRLEIDYPTIPLAELLLEKLQIVNINLKDIKDSIVLIRAHEVGGDDKDKINIKHIANILSQDWGFYYTATTNLNLIKNSLNDYREILTTDDINDVTNKIEKMLTEIERYPKSTSWKLRAKIGTKKKWYKDVGEILRE